MKTDTLTDRPLDDRESAILNAIVYEYILTGKAVGSRSFVQKYSFSLSPATMRNIMFDLERMDYLMQPHTSSGRIPTDKGYRYYVDSLLDNYHINYDQEKIIEDKLIQREMQVEKIFESVTKMLSTVSNYAGVMLSPNPDFTVVKLIELIQIESNEVLLIAISRTGLILTRRVNLSVRVTPDELLDYSSFLTGELCGYSLQEIKSKVFENLRLDRTSNNRELAIDIAQLALNESADSSVNIDGIENLLKIPEMVEEQRLHSLLNIIEEKNLLKNILEKQIEKEGITILIGEEIDNEKVAGCSLVTSSYKIGNKSVGAVGVIGPTRMDYEKVVPLVDYTGKAVSGLLTKMSR
ncbi:MAG TPA: heat-inducible transcriptional repressor HrcA [Spirochaetota bacterium]|nr:heat-inducible transcriptional repressor HrcA [Spirochaetota bacterium]